MYLAGKMGRTHVVLVARRRYERLGDEDRRMGVVLAAAGTEGFVGVAREPRIGPRETSIRCAYTMWLASFRAPQQRQSTSVLIAATVRGPGDDLPCVSPAAGLRVPKAGKVHLG